jgi:hypothetical protein
MTGRSRLSDEQIREALTPALRPGLVAAVGGDIADAIRASRRAPWWARWLAPVDIPSNLVRVGWGAAVTAVLLVGLTLFALAVSQRTRPALGSNGAIAVGSNTAGIMLIDPTTLELRRLAGPWAADVSGQTDRHDLFAVSPDGALLASIRLDPTGWSIPIVDVATGNTVAQVAEAGDGVFPEWGVQWSRDGRTLVLAATVGGLPAVVGVDIDTGARHDISPRGTMARDPAVSPVDDRVAFVRTSAVFGTDYRLVVTDLRGGDSHELLAGSDDGTTIAGSPAWSPDGSALAVTLGRPDGTYALATMGLHDRVPTVITPWLTSWVAGSWSPDGSRILLAISPQGGRAADSDAGDQQAELALIEPDGSHWQTVSARACAGAAWAPDGTAILYDAFGCEMASDTVEVHRFELADSLDQTLWTGARRRTGVVSIDWQALPPR